MQEITRLAVRPDNSIVLGKFVFQRNGLAIEGNPSYDEWYECGIFLSSAQKAVHWWLGDWIRYGEAKWGETYSQALDETAFDYGTLRNDVYVAEKVDLSRRRDNLSFAHHQEVANLEPEEQDEWLEKAERGDGEKPWTRMQLRQELRRFKHNLKLAAQEPTAVESDTSILHGDCLHLLGALTGVDLIITDPPYGLTEGKGAGVREGKGVWDELPPERLHEFNREWLTLAVESLKDNGSIMVFGTVHNIFNVGHILKELGCYIVRDIVWNKPFVQRQVNMNALVPSHELIVWARRGEHHTCNLFEITRDVWDIQPAAPFGHPTEKPEELIKRLIEMASNAGDLVADPFLGSGVITAIAKRLKRRYWGCELSEYWWKIATERTRETAIL